MNNNATGPTSAATVKQTVANDNRRMFLEMMAPINTQLNEMKLIYENTKTCSTDVGAKIDELKKIISLQQNSLMANQPTQQNPFLSGEVNPLQMEQFLDPKVIKKGVAEIKEQMREVQREAHVIESEMEQRFQYMLAQNEAKIANIPQSLTQEVESNKRTI